MKYVGPILIIVAVLAAIVIIGRTEWFASMITPKPKEGSACRDAANNPGIVTNGVCKIVVPPPPPPHEEEVKRTIITAIPTYNSRYLIPTATNVRTVTRVLNSNVGPAERQNACSVAENWCATEYANTGNTNGFYCKVWKAGCGASSRTINFPIVPTGIFTSASAERRSSSYTPVVGYSLCISRSFVMPADVDPIKVNDFLDQLRKEFQYVFNQGHKIILNTIISPNVIAPGTVITFNVYAADCNSDIAKKAITFIINLK